MRRLTATALIAASFALPAAADSCTEEVKSALEKQRKSSSFRMETTMPTYQGIIQMTVDYVPPGKMRQSSKVVATSEVTETVLIDGKAWENAKGAGWKALDAATADEFATQVKSTVVDAPADIGTFKCLGQQTVDGKSVSAYQLVDKQADQSGAYRVFYVDLINGLPVKNVYVLPGREDKPFFKTVYSYPLEIKIDPPAVAP